MKILQLSKFYPPILGGIELVEKMITKAHCSLKDEVFIVAFKQKNENFSQTGEFGELIEWINLDIKLKSAPFNLSFISQFRAYIKENKIERIYVHLPNPFMHELVRFNRKFLNKNRVEVVAVYHSDIINQKILRFFYDKYFVKTADLYHKIIVSSDNLWRFSKVLTKLPADKKTVIPFCSEGNMEFLERKKFGGKLLAIGRLVPYKGFKFLIEALKDTEFELHIIGDGPLYQELVEIKASNVFLHKRLSEKEKNILISQSDLLVVSSINKAEAYGMIIVEAFESGLPVVASNIDSGVTFLVQDKITGKVFETLNKAQLVSAIRYFKENPVEYNAISNKVRSFYESDLSFESFKNKIKIL